MNRYPYSAPRPTQRPPAPFVTKEGHPPRHNGARAKRNPAPPAGATRGLPDVARINRILAENAAGFQIEPPNLVATRQHIPVAVPERPVSLSEQAQEIVQSSLQASEKLLAEGRHRQAVQEILWLLETVATAFHGVENDAGTVQSRYFNKIVADLRAMGRGRNVEQILGWMMTLHGYLSAPKVGGIRHGVDIGEGIVVDANEARLYCNLIRSYITFLILEHERLNKRSGA